MRRKRKKSLGPMVGIIIFSLSIIAIYLSGVIYFKEHFYIGSMINDINVSGKKVDEAKEEIMRSFGKYFLEIKNSDGTSDILIEEEIGLENELDYKIQSIKDAQHELEWILDVFNKKEYELKMERTYDENMLKDRISKLSCLNQSKVITPKDATLRYDGRKYEISKEVQGNKVNEKILYEHIIKAIIEGENTIDLEKAGCYEKPKYTSLSKEIVEAKGNLDKYVSSQIVYEFGDNKEVVDRELISQWINIELNLEITLNKEEIQRYVSMLSNKYDVKSEVREFSGQSGEIVKVVNEEKIQCIDEEQETEDLIKNIKDGEKLTREPIYKEKEIEEEGELVNTYVEIDLTKQYIWFYKKGKLMTQGDIVTGNVSTNHATPPGIFRLNYKQRDTVLRGVGYNSPVDYWMPFNGGIGIHDASWRSEFGGEIYKDNGSHGCINTPYDVVKVIFNNIKPGTIIICYH